MESLEEQISDSIREQLGTKRALESKPSSKGGGGRAQRAASDDDDDDDFYDRTSTKKKGSLAARRQGRPPPTRSAVLTPACVCRPLARKEQAKPAGEVETEATLRAKLKQNAAEQVPG